MKYFVSYFGTYADGRQCWGNSCINRDHPVDSHNEYKSMETFIETANDIKQVTIMYWRRLEDAE